MIVIDTHIHNSDSTTHFRRDYHASSYFFLLLFSVFVNCVVFVSVFSFSMVCVFQLICGLWPRLGTNGLYFHVKDIILVAYVLLSR